MSCVCESFFSPVIHSKFPSASRCAVEFLSLQEYCGEKSVAQFMTLIIH